MEKEKISVAIITKNEANRIGRLLKSCAFADEIIVVDSGSTDGTQELCEKAGVKVMFNQWPGYVIQKQVAMNSAKHEWILSMDADEEVPDNLAREIIMNIAAAESIVAGFSMPRISWYLGRWIKHGGWYPDRKVRLVRRGRGQWQGIDPHDQLFVDGIVKNLNNAIHHYGYRSISDQVAKIDNFSDIYARQDRPKGGWFVVAGIFHAIGKYLECYVWKRGFLDGIPGLVIAMNSAGYVFLKHAKCWEQKLSGS